MPRLDLHVSNLVSNFGNVLRHSKVYFEWWPAASATSDLRKLSTAKLPVDTDKEGRSRRRKFRGRRGRRGR